MHLKMTRILFIFAWLASTTCGASTEEDGLEEYEKYVNEIVHVFASETEKRCNIVCIGDGGRMPYDVEEVEVLFWADRKGTIEEARRIIVTSKRALLDKINAHEKIRPFLREYPFTIDRASTSISFVDKKNGKHYTDGSVAYALEAKGRIIYRRDAVNSPILLALYDEPYEEAERIVAEEEAQGPLQFGPLKHRRSRSFFSKLFSSKRSE